MQVLIKNVPNAESERIIIECVRMNEYFEDIREFAIAKETFIIGYIDRSAYRLNVGDIIYFEAVGEEVFAYTDNEYYSVKKRLYEIERDYTDKMFIRCSRSMVINICQIGSFRPEKDGRYIVKMNNGEDIIVSRTYAKVVKNRITKVYAE